MEDVVSWMGDVFDSLNDNSGAVQAIATVVLVIVTFAYVLLTAKQAKASVGMTEEMREQRFDALRPVVLPRIDVKSINGSPFCEELLLENIGVGPALDVQCNFTHPNLTQEGGRWAIGAGRTVKWMENLRREPAGVGERDRHENDTAQISVSYRDVYGRRFSSGSVLVCKEGSWQVTNSSVEPSGADGIGRVGSRQ